MKELCSEQAADWAYPTYRHIHFKDRPNFHTMVSGFRCQQLRRCRVVCLLKEEHEYFEVQVRFIHATNRS